jgi:hypothetical protein
VLELDKHRGGIHAPLASRCVHCARTVRYISLKIIVRVSDGNPHKPTPFAVEKVRDGYLGSNVSITNRDH